MEARRLRLSAEVPRTPGQCTGGSVPDGNVIDSRYVIPVHCPVACPGATKRSAVTDILPAPSSLTAKGTEKGSDGVGNARI